MADFDEGEEFFEEDESPEKIHSLFDAGEKGLTVPPYLLGEPMSTYATSEAVSRDVYALAIGISSSSATIVAVQEYAQVS